MLYEEGQGQALLINDDEHVGQYVKVNRSLRQTVLYRMNNNIRTDLMQTMAIIIRNGLRVCVPSAPSDPTE